MIIFHTIFLAWMLPCIASDELKKEIHEQYNQGAYFQTILLLSELEKEKSSGPIAWYWKAICFQKLQEHKEAISFFGKALQSGNFPREIYYQYGQSLFADSRFTQAQDYFHKSWVMKIKPGHSLFYIAHSYQLEGQHEKAISYYQKIASLKNIDANIRQAASAQLAEVYLAINKESGENQTQNVVSRVIPQMQMAIEDDAASLLARELKKRINDIQLQYGISSFSQPKPYAFMFNQSIKYDSNVTLTPDNTTNASAVKQASPLISSELFGKYSLLIGHKFKTSPEVRMSFDKYLENSQATVYQNNELFLGLSVRNAYQHSLFGPDSALLLDFEYGQIKRDYLMTRSLDDYGKSHTFILGQDLQNTSGGGPVPCD